MRVVAGNIASAHAVDDVVRLYVRERGDERLREIHAGWVLNCTGPAASNSAESNPAIGSLLLHNFVRPDELGLGLDTTAEGNAIRVNGDVMPDLFVVGTLRKPGIWESTAVPELRNQAAAVAELRASPSCPVAGCRGGDISFLRRRMKSTVFRWLADANHPCVVGSGANDPEAPKGKVEK